MVGADRLKDNYDINPGFGGPIMQDKLWFFVAVRYKNSANYADGMYYDKNQNNPNVWVFEPDLNRPAANPSIWTGGQLRLSWQVAAKHKFGVSWNDDVVELLRRRVSVRPWRLRRRESRIYPVQRQRRSTGVRR